MRRLPVKCENPAFGAGLFFLFFLIKLYRMGHNSSALFFEGEGLCFVRVGEFSRGWGLTRILGGPLERKTNHREHREKRESTEALRG